MLDSMLCRGLSRRQILKTASCGFGFLALADLCTRIASAESANPLASKAPHFKARARHVIFMYMGGAPSHVDTFDYKPKLATDDGKSVDGTPNARKFMKSPFKFSRHGKAGL